jgi:hypothetical protein
VGKHSTIVKPGGQLTAVARRPERRPIRSRLRLTALAFVATFAILFVMVIDPYAGAYAASAEAPNHWVVINGQTYIAAGSYTISASRDHYTVSQRRAPTVVASTAAVSGAPAAPVPSPGSAKAIALSILQSKGMGNDQYSCLVSLWDRESGWRVNAANPSGAYGIPQALPGSKMASAGPNWQTNPKTQILWGLGYISARYGNPCGAWAHSQSTGWY